MVYNTYNYSIHGIYKPTFTSLRGGHFLYKMLHHHGYGYGSWVFLFDLCYTSAVFHGVLHFDWMWSMTWGIHPECWSMAYEIRQLEKWRQKVVEYGKSDKSERLQQVD